MCFSKFAVDRHNILLNLISVEFQREELQKMDGFMITKINTPQQTHPMFAGIHNAGKFKTEKKKFILPWKNGRCFLYSYIYFV
jgi:hypothetical protein